MDTYEDLAGRAPHSPTATDARHQLEPGASSAARGDGRQATATSARGHVPESLLVIGDGKDGCIVEVRTLGGKNPAPELTRPPLFTENRVGS